MSSATAPITQQARALLLTRLGQLEQEQKKVARAVEILGPADNGNGSEPARRRTRRKRQAGGRTGQALELIAARPGITAGEVAKEMKIKPNYLYRVLGDLQKQKKVKKSGRTYTAA